MAVLYVCSLIYTDISFFFCNYTATAESYTYSHTLSLPDALPIFVALRKIGIERVDRARRVCRDIVVHRLRVGPQRRGPVAGRSEEHTSELQSLMRNSYAVFCLKQTKQYVQLYIINTTSQFLI